MTTPCVQVNLTGKVDGLFNIVSQKFSELIDCHARNSAVNKLSIRFAAPEHLENKIEYAVGENCRGSGAARTAQVFIAF